MRLHIISVRIWIFCQKINVRSNSLWLLGYWEKIKIKKCCLYEKLQYSIVCVIYSNITHKSCHYASQIIRKLHVPNFWSEKLGVTFNLSCLPTGPSHMIHPLLLSSVGLRPAGHLSLLPPSVLSHHTFQFSSWDSWDPLVHEFLHLLLPGLHQGPHWNDVSWSSDHVPLWSILQWLHTAIWKSPKSFTWFLSLEGMACVYFHFFFSVSPPYGVKSVFISMYYYFNPAGSSFSTQRLCACGIPAWNTKTLPYHFLAKSYPSFSVLTSSKDLS